MQLLNFVRVGLKGDLDVTKPEGGQSALHHASDLSERASRHRGLPGLPAQAPPHPTDVHFLAIFGLGKGLLVLALVRSVVFHSSK